MMRRAWLSPALLLAAPVLFFAAFFLAPLAVVALASATGGPDGLTPTAAQYLRVLADQYHWDVILVTFRLALFTTLACLVLGYPLAWYLVRVVRWQASVSYTHLTLPTKA